MADLLAIGREPQHRWRHTLPAGPVTLGRLAAKAAWDVPWDRQISGLHATLTWQHGKLLVRRDPAARNLIFFRGSPADEFTMAFGEQFVIGETTFFLDDIEATPEDDAAPAVAELTCSRQELQQHLYADAGERIEALAALPAIIRFSPSDDELERRVLEVLLRGMPHADVAAVVCLDPAGTGKDTNSLVRRAARRDGQPADLKPSRRLLTEAVRRRRQSVVHRWAAAQSDSWLKSIGAGNWALCAPLPDEPAPGWALYVAGGLPPRVQAGDGLTDLQKSDLKFGGLVADIFGALRQVRALQHRQSALSRFLSRPVLAAIADRDMDEVLRPRETEVTVLFCDLRGSCRLVEEGAQALSGLAECLGEALSVMTTHIIDKDGVIGDFHGDAAMGFWGWPVPLVNQVEQAARAALGILRDFSRAARRPGHVLAGFACGIGIANGPAIAGRLGTVDQFKVSVFGPVVNLASRLEAMTRRLQVPILVDERTAQRLAGAHTSHWVRCRRLARVRPHGMTQALTVSELLPAAVEAGAMSENHRRDYEAALDAFIAGHWQDTRDLLERLPPDCSAFLRASMDRLGTPPPGAWDGTITLDSK
jgi:adenylate cyclase